MIIGSRRRYVGGGHPGIQGLMVQIVAVHRGPAPDLREILTDDEEIGEILPTDIVEVAPVIVENGEERISWATSDALRAHLTDL